MPGEEGAFLRHYREVHPGLLRFVSARIRDPHAAHDLLQEVYAKAFRHWGDYDPERSFRPWIYAIARNACIDHLRRRLRDPLAGLAPNAPAEPPDMDAIQDPNVEDPAAAAERRDLLDTVRKELTLLPDKRRVALEMKILDGLTYREIADALDAPLGTVAYWVREAVEAVARRLEHLQ